MESRSGDAAYALVLAEYLQRFHSRPPSILTNEAALALMRKALQRGSPISEIDLSPKPTMARRSRNP